MALVNRYSQVKQGLITTTGNTLVLCQLTPGFGSGTFTTAAGGTTTNWALDGSSANLSILAESTVLYAELIWYSTVFSWGGAKFNSSRRYTDFVYNT